MQARYYDPVIGRFYSNDPVGYTAANPVMSFNRYMYANNNPYKYTDPDGEFIQFAIGAAVGFISEVATQYATSGGVNDWGKVGLQTGMGAATGGYSIATKGLSLGSTVAAHVANESMGAAGAATVSLISDGLNGNADGSFTRAGEAALNSVAGIGKSSVAATKGGGQLKKALSQNSQKVDVSSSLKSDIKTAGDKIVSNVAAGTIDEKINN
ncbi:RHS repeat-associated core domain-containing protein [Psychrosphaera sp. F3M07]|uniref:RHS repeat-associated core domain-containing protein n=1 Tax=Psychrosphaera sp. F3M07 TaxID=2841560 RepID=UPI002090B835|nr:RHS repeat-associated core domain-containing protein [Psychrosphaera sp. F3M07]